MTTARSAALVDAAAGGPVLVTGTPPPHGRDLDLLARPEDAGAIGAALAAAGYASVAGLWLAVTGDGPDVVDVKQPRSYGLGPDEVDAVLAEAVPVEGCSRLVAPGPATTLLLLARRAVRAGELDERRRARAAAALAADPDAWEAAARRAPAWGAGPALEVLREVLDGRTVGRRQRADALRALQATAGARGPVAALRAWRTVGRRRGRVITISGLDGAGKSSQAAALVAVLEQTGQPAVAQWTRLAGDDVLDRIAKPVQRALRAGRRGAVRAPAPSDVHPSRVATPEKALRQGSPVLTLGWATVVALVNGLNQRRSTRPHLRAGRVVVCDRWTLDSAVHLRYRYGERRRYAAQVALIRLLSPRPAASFLLDIPGDVAYARKDDHYDVEQLVRHQRLYAEEVARAGVLRLDGQRPREELTAEIAAVALTALRTPRGLRSLLRRPR